MKGRKFIIPIIIIVAIMISLASVRPVRATGDTIYFSPSNTSAPAPGSIITIRIMADTVGYSGGGGINGWDLVITDNDPSATTLNPIAISKAGNLLESFGSVSELVNCVNNGVGIISGQPGNIGCDSARDGPGIVHTAAVLQGPATPTPVSGRIATINYTTVGSTFLTIGILSPCPSFCDQLTDGSSNPVPHTTLKATYGSPGAPGDFRLSAPNGTSPAPLSPGASGTTKVNVTSLTGATGSVAFTQTTYPSTGLTFSCTTVALLANQAASSTCTYTSKVPGTYFVTVNATNSGSPNTFHLAPVTIIVSDFSVAANIASLGILKGNNTASANITATSINGFSGTLAISGKATTTPATTGGLLVTCSPTSISITPTTPATSKCTFTAVKSNTYSVTLNANYTIPGGGFLVRHAGVTVVVQDFQITSNPGLVTFGAGKTGSSVVTVKSFPSGQGKQGFSGNVAITVSSNDTRLVPSCPGFAGQTVFVNATISPSGTCVYSGLGGLPASPGAYAVTITGTFTRGTITITNSTKVNVTVSADFTLVASSASMSPGNTGSSTITVTGYGVSSPVSLTYNIPSGLTCPTATLPTSITPNNTAVLPCTSTTTGQFNVSITGNSGALTHVGIATFNSGPDIAVTKVTVSTTTATVGDKITVTVSTKYNGTGSNFQIYVKWGGVTVVTQNATSGAGPDYTITWTTTGLAPGTAVISASVPPLTVGAYTESTVADNNATGPMVTLNAPSSSPVSGVVLYGIIGAVVVAAAGVGGYVFLRRRRASAPGTPATKV